METKSWKKKITGPVRRLPWRIVSTLPIRNGNLYWECWESLSFWYSKYLTYKEWKQAYNLTAYKQDLSYRKYLTYKEWKRNVSELLSSFHRKYLTYKEWKLVKRADALFSIVLHICKYLTYKEWKPVGWV